MKKIKTILWYFLYFTLSISLVIVFTSCPKPIDEALVLVVEDKLAPEITISSPGDNTYYKGDVVVTGNITDSSFEEGDGQGTLDILDFTVSDASILDRVITFTADGSYTVEPADSTFSYNQDDGSFGLSFSSVGLSGVRKINFNLQDKNGNAVEKEITLYEDEDGPYIVVAEPEDQTQWGSFLNLSGTITNSEDDANTDLINTFTCKVTFIEEVIDFMAKDTSEDYDYSFNQSTGAFSLFYDIPGWQSGNLGITLTAEDANGHETEYKMSLYDSTTGPEITFSSPQSIIFPVDSISGDFYTPFNPKLVTFSGVINNENGIDSSSDYILTDDTGDTILDYAIFNNSNGEFSFDVDFSVLTGNVEVTLRVYDDQFRQSRPKFNFEQDSVADLLNIQNGSLASDNTSFIVEFVEPVWGTIDRTEKVTYEDFTIAITGGVSPLVEDAFSSMTILEEAPLIEGELEGATRIRFDITLNDTETSGDEDLQILPKSGVVFDRAGNTMVAIDDDPLQPYGDTNNVNLYDMLNPYVTGVTTDKNNIHINDDDYVDINVTFNEDVVVSGTPRIQLNTDVTRYAVYTGLTGVRVNPMTFRYTVQDGDDTAGNLDFTTATIDPYNGTIIDTAAVPNTAVYNSLNLFNIAGRQIVIDTTHPLAADQPQLILPDDTYINRSENGAGFTLRVPLGTSGALEGDEVELLNNTSSFSPAVTELIDSTDILNRYCDVPVPAAALGDNGGTGPDDGSKTIRARIIDEAGNEGPESSGYLGLTLDTVYPTIGSVNSDTADGYYNDLAGLIDIDVAFSEPVVVTGTPRIQLETGSTDALVNYSGGSGSPGLTFNYDIADGENSADLGYINSDALSLNGGTIRDLAGNNAVLTLPAPGAPYSLSYSRAIVVDTLEPTADITYTSDGPHNESPYNQGTNVTITATFSEPIKDFPGPQPTISFSGVYLSGPGTMTRQSSAEYTYVHSVGTGDGTETIALSGGTDLAGNTIIGIPSSGGTFDVDNTAPSVNGVSTDTGNGYYNDAAAFIDIDVGFSEEVDVTGTPRIQLETGAADAWVNYSGGTGTIELTFDYDVVDGHNTGDLDYTGIGALDLNGGTIKDLAGNTANTLFAEPGTDGSLAYSHDLIIDTDEPSVSGVSTDTANGYYNDSAALIDIDVAFTEKVNVTGTPRIRLETGATDAWVNYSGGTGNSELTFNYNIADGHNTGDLDYTGTGALDLNGGTIKDLAGNTADPLLAEPGTDGSLGYSHNLVIDTVEPTADISYSSVGPYKQGTVITITAGFSEDMKDLPGPQPNIAFSGVYTQAAAQMTRNSAVQYEISHTVGAGNGTENITLSVGTDLAGNVITGTPDSGGSFTVDNTGPSVSGVSSDTSDGAYNDSADLIAIDVAFYDTVYVTGMPQITLNSGATVNYSGGSSTDVLTFSYDIADGENSAVLDYTGTGALTLNGGTIKDYAGNDSSLTLASPGSSGSLSDNQTIKIDTDEPTVDGVSTDTADGSYNDSAALIDIVVAFSEPVNVTGTPRIRLETGATDAWVNYSGGTGTSELTFDYDVVDGHNSGDLDYTGTGALDLNGGTIKDPAGNSAFLTLVSPGNDGSLSYSHDIVIDTAEPAAFLITFSPKPTEIYSPDDWNGDTTEIYVNVPIEDGDGSLISGSVELQAKKSTESSFADLGINSSIADASDKALTVTEAKYKSIGDPNISEGQIGVIRAIISDKAGNQTISTNSISLTRNESAPYVTAISANPTTLLNGVTAFEIQITYSEGMDGTDSSPSLTFTPDVSSIFGTPDIIFSNPSNKFTITYPVTDDNIDQSGIDIEVSGADDDGGTPEVQVTCVFFDVFSLNQTSSALLNSLQTFFSGGSDSKEAADKTGKKSGLFRGIFTRDEKTSEAIEKEETGTVVSYTGGRKPKLGEFSQSATLPEETPENTAVSAKAEPEKTPEEKSAEKPRAVESSEPKPVTYDKLKEIENAVPPEIPSGESPEITAVPSVMGETEAVPAGNIALKYLIFIAGSAVLLAGAIFLFLKFSRRYWL